jgi:hypothetical protein
MRAKRARGAGAKACKKEFAALTSPLVPLLKKGEMALFVFDVMLPGSLRIRG